MGVSPPRNEFILQTSEGQRPPLARHIVSERRDQVVVLGDVFEMGQRIAETCQLLAQSQALGVWGNHDYGLCVDPDAETRLKYGDGVIRFMGSLRPRLEIEGCHFTHVEPWLNPEDVADLWYFDGPPDAHGKLERMPNTIRTAEAGRTDNS